MNRKRKASELDTRPLGGEARTGDFFARHYVDPYASKAPVPPTESDITDFKDRLESPAFSKFEYALRPIENPEFDNTVVNSGHDVNPVVTQLERVAPHIRDIIRRDTYFRTVLWNVRLNMPMAGSELRPHLLSAGLSIEKRNEHQLLCAPVVEMSANDPMAKALAQVDDDDTHEMTMPEIEQFLRDYSETFVHDEDEDESYIGIMEDHMRFVFDIRAADPNADTYIITDWVVDFS